MNSNIVTELHKVKSKGQSGSTELDIITVQQELILAEKYATEAKTIQHLALKEQILPARYLRNFGTMGFDGQLSLLNSSVLVVGQGGLGGVISELLARMGVGHLILIDNDHFEDNNLNRQLLAREDNLGSSKIEAARERISRINSAVSITPYTLALNEGNAVELLNDCNIAIDALDNMSTRFVLQKACREIGVPMVHGAIGGFSGQVTTIFPEDRGLETLYSGIKDDSEEYPDKLAEVELGNPAATPTITASWQAQEAIKYLTGKGELLRHRLLYLDSYTGNVEVINF